MPNNYTTTTLIPLILLEICSRLIAFPLGFSPTLPILLLLGSRYPVKIALAATLFASVLFDGIASFYFNFPFWGAWSLFTYSGFLFVTLLGTLVRRDMPLVNIAGFSLSASLIFWLWTNAGVWLVYAHYPAGLPGLLLCYINALPFLYKAVLGNVFWTIIIFGILKNHFRITLCIVRKAKY